MIWIYCKLSFWTLFTFELLLHDSFPLKVDKFLLFLKHLPWVRVRVNLSTCWMSTCRPERVCGNETPTEVKRFVQCARHFFAGFVVRAQVLYAGQQLGQTLAEEHLRPRALRRWAAHAVWAHAWTVCQGVHLWILDWKKRVFLVLALKFEKIHTHRPARAKKPKCSRRNAFGLISPQTSLVGLVAAIWCESPPLCPGHWK